MYVNIQVFADRARKYFLFGLFNFVVTIAISVVLVYQYPHTLIGPMWGRLLSGVLIFLLTFIYGLREFGIQLVFKATDALRKYSTPIVIFSLLTWVLGYINNYILNGLSTAKDVGVYDFALKCTLVIEYAGLGLLGTINPRIYQLWKKNGNTESTQEENRYYHAYSAVNILLIAVNMLVLPIVIKLFIRNEGYYESLIYLPVLLASFAFKGMYGMLVNPAFYFKKTKILPKVLLWSSIVQIASGVILIHYFDVWGAVWSFFLVKPLQIFFLWIEVRKIFRFRFNLVKMVGIPVGYMSIVILLTSLNVFQKWYPTVIQAFIAVIIIVFAYRNELIELPKLVKKQETV